MQRQLRRENYTVGWVCALPVELAAAKAMLDEKHADASRDSGGDDDHNVYCMGSVAGHNVVIGCLPAGRIGVHSAAVVATQMQAAFKGIRFGLMVGIGGGVPSAEADIRLGDVVVSQPQWSFGGVVQYDFGRLTPNGLERIGSLNSPPQILLSALSVVQANAMVGESTLSNHLSTLERLHTFQRRRAGPDLLFNAAYNHEHGATCDQCSDEHRQSRAERESGVEVEVHYGTIASGNCVIKDAAERDKVSAELGGVLCFEMEAAGLMNSYPCLVIRGISDYADTHKNYKWQAYAAGTAAAYAKELLSAIPAAAEVMNTNRREDALRTGDNRCLQLSSPYRSSHIAPKTVTSSDLESVSAKKQASTRPIHPQGPSRKPLNSEQRKLLLESLRFEEINTHQVSIKTAHAKTCRWLLGCEQYLDWLDATKLDQHHGFLWIKSKAGAGKSTLMKFAFINVRSTMSDHAVLSFFFNARGAEIEKSIVGTYRSLLLQLLEQLPALQGVFDSLSLPTSKLTEDYKWNVESLKTLLEQAIRSLGDSPAICFIDALDEGEEEQIRDMISFFEHIGDLAILHDIRFYICFSSRHYPYITVRNGLELMLERQEGHLEDISSYIMTELKIGESKTAHQVRAELQEKSSGIFMWVVLVVGILNRESDRGKVHTLRKKLHEIPSDLHELFYGILTRDLYDKNELVLCIQWVLFTKQPLSPEQLYHAIYTGTNPEAIKEWDSEDISKDVIQLFILSCSKGLVEVTVSEQQQRVQFIHESVRDFLLKGNGLSKIWPEYGNNFQSQSHDRLKQCCLEYSLNSATFLQLPEKLPEAYSQQAANLHRVASQRFPFLRYAVHNMLYHADTAQGGGIPQTDFLNSFPLSRWVQLHTMVYEREVTEHVTLLYLLAKLNAANLIRIHPSIESCLDVEDERYGCAFFAANAFGNQEAMQACIEGLQNALSLGDCGGGWSEESLRDTTVGSSLGRDFAYQKQEGLLWYAAQIRIPVVFAYLFGRGLFDLDSRDAKGRTALYATAANGATFATRMLLERGASPDVQGGYYGNALQAALTVRSKEIVTMLLDKGANVNAQGGRYGNALQAASVEGLREITRLLLDKGADVNAQGGYYGNALQAALIGGYEEIVTLLLDKGADVNAQGGCYGNALQAASVKGQKEIVTLLLEKGADVHAQGGLYSNALHAASDRHHEEVVILLQQHSASAASK